MFFDIPFILFFSLTRVTYRPIRFTVAKRDDFFFFPALNALEINHGTEDMAIVFLRLTGGLIHA